MTITLPHNYKPRDYQIPFYNNEKDRSIQVAHRRWGKDKTALNRMITRIPRRKGTYYYMLPEQAQARKVIWSGMDKDGFPFIGHFPHDYIKNKLNTEMRIELKDGSAFQLVGSDNFNSLMGTNPVGLTFSEFSLQNPAAWDFFRPILRENKGWADFIFTFRGKNHAYDLYKMAEDNPDWFCGLQTVDDTHNPDGTPVITAEDIQRDREEGMDEALIQQEYYCNPEGALLGAYYGEQIRQAAKAGRICSVPYNQSIPVHTHWDIGKGDHMAIWFSQKVGMEIHIIDCYTGMGGESLSDFVKVLKERGYVYGCHYMPHDAEPTQVSTGKSLKAMAEDMGLRPVVLVPKLSIEAGREAVRMMFTQYYFDEDHTKPGMDALKQHHKQWDVKRKMWQDVAHKDWSEHFADAFRYLSVVYRFLDVGGAQSYEIDTDYQPSLTRRKGLYD